MSALDAGGLARVGAGTSAFLETVAGIGDDDFGRSTLLPRWRVAHVVAHVHFNALALQRLLTWARTGEPHPMYEPGQRDAEVEDGATWSPARLRAAVGQSAEGLLAGLDAVTSSDLATPLRSAKGREITVADVPWMRSREVWVHALDLGMPSAHLPEDVVGALLVDAAGARASASEGPALAAWLTGRAAEPPRLGPWL
ncbi:maleylpyruvate isomerase [Knoellia remsis]|uniref:Maleylpyruvate isomerase n=1 Tax=Knoellia remsis TaxID=407159 RepID=A0A2T0UQH2_9MICO|nr:maleylpyruvate isomerase N-terminal domain-containing protein [Knoellia remsis]PRY60156.1 maleylpyruvate isomerase [Knoellia remsis]